VVQISALGADTNARSAYHLSKRAADDVLRGLPLRAAIVQPSLVYGPGGTSAALFNKMAMAPLLPLPATIRHRNHPPLETLSSPPALQPGHRARASATGRTRSRSPSGSGTTPTPTSCATSTSYSTP